MVLILIWQSQVTSTAAVSTLIKSTVWCKPGWNRYRDFLAVLSAVCVYTALNNFSKWRIIMMIDDSIKVHPTQFLQKMYLLALPIQSVCTCFSGSTKAPKRHWVDSHILCSGDSIIFGDTFPLPSKTVSNWRSTWRPTCVSVFFFTVT